MLQFRIRHVHAWTMLKQILNVFVTAQSIQAGHFDDRIDAHAGIGSVNGSAEQPVLPTVIGRTEFSLHYPNIRIME